MAISQYWSAKHTTSDNCIQLTEAKRDIELEVEHCMAYDLCLGLAALEKLQLTNLKKYTSYKHEVKTYIEKVQTSLHILNKTEVRLPS